jgi:hypothetical protein
MSATTLHRARKTHPCNTYLCDGEIQPGELYVRYVVFPGDDGYEEGTEPRSMRICGRCVDRNGGCMRERYGVPAHLGGEVVFDGQPGVIVDLRGGHVYVRLDGGKVVNVHPTWRIEYRQAVAA